MSEVEPEKPTKLRRTYKACLSCRTRKVRCDLGPVDSPQDPPCARCKRERKECVFADSRRGGYHGSVHKKVKLDATVINSKSILDEKKVDDNEDTSTTSKKKSKTIKMKDNLVSSGTSNSQDPSSPSFQSQFQEETKSIPPPTTRSSEFTTMQGALVFLARAAGTIARADDRDNINAREIHEKLETSEDNNSISSNNQNSTNSSPVLQSNSVNSRSNSASNLASTGTEYQMIAPLVRPHGRKPAIMPPLEKSSTVRPNPSKTLNDIEYIGENKMLTEAEAIRLIELFFLTMHPFFPHIPEQLHDPQVLAGYPILLCAILTISSRYHPFDNEENINNLTNNLNSRNVQLHERLWIYCQRLISQTVWAEASTRSVGTVLAFLLFTEWNPRAIHWRWSDYANNPEFKDDMGKSGPLKNHNVEDDDDGSSSLTGLDAMRRSDRMAWMLIGTSIRLAQDMGFINTSSKIFVATHISETNTAMNLGQRSMLAQSLAEIDIDDDDNLRNNNDEIFDNNIQIENDEDILNLNDDIIKRHGLSTKKMKFTFAQKAKIELLKIMSLAYETIYNNGKSRPTTDSQKQTITILSILSPLIENWYKNFKKLLKPCNPKNFNHHCNLKHANNPKHVKEISKQVDKESLICDYYYCQLYIYSLALSIENPNDDVSSSSNSNNIDEISKTARYVELAYNAANEILNAATRVHKIKMLKNMPVRWCTRIVRSVAFIIKCFLTLTNATNKKQSEIQKTNSFQTSTILKLSIIPTEEIIQTIQKAAIVLREASPDELHLCTRYSTILMYLCSEMKYRSRVSFNPPLPRKLNEAESDEEDVGSSEHPTPSAQHQYEQQEPLPQSQPQPAATADIPAQYQQHNYQPQQQPNPVQLNSMNFGYQQMGGGQTSTSNIFQPLPEAVMDWFMKNDGSVGLDFVEPWTEMIEQHLDKNKDK